MRSSDGEGMNVNVDAKRNEFGANGQVKNEGNGNGRKGGGRVREENECS